MENQYKLMVKVNADHELGGEILPRYIVLPSGNKVAIDRVLDARPAPALKACGQGMRYTLSVRDKTVYLFHDRLDWFIETNGDGEAELSAETA